MEAEHLARARSLAPEAADRIRMISQPDGELVGAGDAGVRDPIGGTAAAYSDTFNRIQ